MERSKKIFTGLSLLIAAMCCGAWLLFSVPGSGWKAEIVPTGSMRPAIAIGSLVLVHRVPIASLRVGDVITYVNPLKPSQTISHRIVKKYLISGMVPGFVTKGDANPSADIPIAGGSVQGRVVWHVPWVGSALLWARTPLGLAVILYVPALLIVTEEVKRLAEYYKQAEPYRLPGYLPRRPAGASSATLMLTVIFVAAVTLIAAVAERPALAQLHSNTVRLVHNSISVKAKKPKNCHEKNDNDVVIQTGSQQTTTSGDSSGSSGAAANSNATSVSVTITNPKCQDS